MSDTATTQRAVVIDPDANLTDEQKIDRLRGYAVELAVRTGEKQEIVDKLVMSAATYFHCTWPDERMEWIGEIAEEALLNRPQ